MIMVEGTMMALIIMMNYHYFGNRVMEVSMVKYSYYYDDIDNGYDIMLVYKMR